MTQIVMGLFFIVTNVGIGIFDKLSWFTVIGVAAGAFLLGLGVGKIEYETK